MPSLHLSLNALRPSFSYREHAIEASAIMMMTMMMMVTVMMMMVMMIVINLQTLPNRLQSSRATRRTKCCRQVTSSP